MNVELRSTHDLMSREWLISIRKKALRRRVWFGVLTKMERCAVDLTIRCVDRFRSARLALVISRIVCKILKLFKSRFLEKAEAVGYDLAERISKIAVGWGYAGALGWKRDLGFIRFLGTNAINSIPNWSRV